MMETSIYVFHTRLYATVTKKLSSHVTHVFILGTNNCGSTRYEMFKSCGSFKYVLCCCDYEELVGANFPHQIQYEYYGRNRSVSIEGIVLEHFSYNTQNLLLYAPKPLTLHAVFN